MIDSTAWRRLIAAVLIVLSAAAARPIVAAAQEAAAGGPIPYLLDARVVGDDSRVRFIADMSATRRRGSFALPDPTASSSTCPEVHFVLPEAAGTGGAGGWSRPSATASSPPGKSRIVIDVTGPVAIDKQFVVQPANGQPARLVIDAVPTTREKFLEAAKAYRDSHEVALAAKSDRAPVRPAARATCR